MSSPPPRKPTSFAIGRDLEDQIEALLTEWRVTYRRGHPVTTSFGTRFLIDFWLPFLHPPVVIEGKNFGVAAQRTGDSRGRKAQEALYLLCHIRRHCEETRGARIVLVTGRERFRSEQMAFLSAELGPGFHVVSVEEPETLRMILQSNSGNENTGGALSTQA
jgi:hypothetical protein